MVWESCPLLLSGFKRPILYKLEQDYKRIQIHYVERASHQCRSVFGRKEHYVVVPKIEMKTRAVDNRAVLMKALARRIGVGA